KQIISEKPLVLGKVSPKIVLLALLLLFFSSNLVSETSALRPPRYISYTSEDVASAETFIATLQEGDIIVPHKKAEWLLYYVDTPREYLATTIEERDWVRSTYSSTNFNASMNSIPDSWSGAKRIHVVSLLNYYYDSKETLPFAEVLEDFSQKKLVGSMIVFTFDIPYHVKDVPLRIVNRVSTQTVPAIPEEPSQMIRSPSNVVFIDSSNRFIIYYAVTGNNPGLSYATSTNGVTWEKSPKPAIEGVYEEPYLTLCDGGVYLYCLNEDNRLLRFEGLNGFNWGSEMETLIDIRSQYDFFNIESPVVWVENGTWRMISTVTLSGDDIFNSGLMYAESADGMTWSRVEDKADWSVQIAGDRDQEVRKYTLSDIYRDPYGYVLLGKMISLNIWDKYVSSTGYLSVLSLDSKNTVFTAIDFSDIDEKTTSIDYLSYIINPFNGRPQFFYIDYSEAGKTGITKGIALGFISLN
ncbi:MAG TPA: hypothetical protein VGB32_01990, partial [Candidatus Bathyarchaeia archaeon]